MLVGCLFARAICWYSVLHVIFMTEVTAVLRLGLESNRLNVFENAN